MSHVEPIFAPASAAAEDSTDAALLAAYVQGSQEAFRTLTVRYADLVYCSALRHVKNPAAAEDVTQAVFLLLVRKAKTMAPHVLLASWLHRAAHFCAREALRTQRRAKTRELAAARPEASIPPTAPADPSPETAAIRNHIDTAMLRLDATTRQALLLRFFQQQPVKTVAASLGMTENTAAQRISRGLAKLRQYFAAHNITLAEASLAPAILAGSAHAPAALTAGIAGSAALSASILALAHAGGRSLMLAKLKLIAAITFASVAAASILIAAPILLAPDAPPPYRPASTLPAPTTLAATVASSTAPATTIAADPVLPFDKLRADLLADFSRTGATRNPSENPSPEIANDWVEAVMQMLQTREADAMPPMRQSQYATLMSGLRRSWNGTFFYSTPWTPVTNTMHPLRYALIREQMIKLERDFLDTAQSEAITRPQAIEQLRALTDEMCGDLLREFPNLDPDKTKRDVDSQFSNVLEFANDPIRHSFKRPATPEDIKKVRDEWGGPSGELNTDLIRNANSRPGYVTEIGPFITRHILFMHGYWDRIPIEDPPSLVAAQKAFDDKKDEIVKYEEEQIKEASFSVAEEYVPALPLPYLKPPQPAKETWGEESHGIQIRLFAENTTLNADEHPVLTYQLRNNSKEKVNLYIEPGNDEGLVIREAHGHQIELDGTRYIRNPFRDDFRQGFIDDNRLVQFNRYDNQPIRPAHRSIPVSFPFDASWRAAKPGASAKELQAATRPALAAGEHTIRFIYLLDAASKPPKEVFSNSIIITIRPNDLQNRPK